MKIARVFPRRTNATPTDALAFVGDLPEIAKGSSALPEVDEVHVSCTFTYDRAEAERLAVSWSALGVPVKLGGPAFGAPGGEFEPGMYLKPGYVITSRGCPNRCTVNGVEYCTVPQREGKLRELEIKDGWNVLDDNLLACSEGHIRAVFAMLGRQKERILLTGGLEAARLRYWHVDLILQVRPKEIFFAYDTPGKFEPLVDAGVMLRRAGYTVEGHILRCYVLIGYPGDTFDKAETRLLNTLRAGFMPMAMLYKDENGTEDPVWRRFQGQWARPAEIHGKLRTGEIRI